MHHTTGETAAYPIPPSPITLPDELRGPRVTVRPYRLADAEAMYEAVDESRETLVQWFNWVGGYQTVSDARNYCLQMAAAWLTHEALSCGVFEAASGLYLGSAGLMRPNWAARRFELGYWIRRSQAGRGYVSEAVQLTTQLAFEHLAARRVEIRCDARNERSRRVAERLGFVFEGRLRNDSVDPQGHSRDMLVFSLIPEDYSRVREIWWEHAVPD